MAECGFGFSFDMELEKPLDFFDVVYKNGEKVRYEQRPHGEWRDYQDEEYSYLANCSKCGYQMNTHEEHGYFNFCPNCGSDNRKKSPCDHCIDDSDCDRCDVPRERR